MSRAYKKQMLHTVDLLEKANRTLEKAIPKGKATEKQIAQLLTDCQEAAISMGNGIEAVYGKGTACVRELEYYCESIYQMYISPDLIPKRKELLEQVKRQVKRIRRLAEEELSGRLEVVFLPYKASMWDSLESVWKAAEEDPKCDAYVVPIPYYDKASDGSISKWHYEINKYPNDVPLIHYQEYQIEERMPDIIFVHSPYDNGNYVTSVHPDFYCERLRGLTDLLVYVPYFVNLYNVPKHLCVCAGTLYADLVATQSKIANQTYIDAFRQFEEENHCRNRFGDPERKFVSLGSPKIDHAASASKSGCVLPDAWEKRLTGVDGRKKKIVLLNTTLTLLLKHEKAYLLHLREVFEKFQMQEEVLLWWRPHPLADATVSSMRPELYEDYQELIDDYRKNNFGIYDDSADIRRAVAWCDACYGDNSSVLVLVWAAKKPILYRDVVSGFAVDDPQNGNFMDVVDPSRRGIGKMILFEAQAYSLEHFLYDITHEDRYKELMAFMESHFDAVSAETYENLGHAGEEIYKAAKKRLTGGRRS